MDCQKDLFDLPEEVVYLNCAAQSPLLKKVVICGQEGLALKVRPWLQGVAQRFANAEKARSLFAQLIGASADDIAIIPSVSYGATLAANNLPVKKGQKIVMIAEEFPSDVYPWREVARSSEGEIFTVPRPENGDWTEAMLGAIDTETAIVSVPNCHWTDGSLIDLERIGEKARSVGAALVIDATQSLGAYPLDVKKVQPDFLVAATYKWLMAGYTFGFLYAHPSRQNGTPLEFGWLNRVGSDDYSRVAEYVEEYQAGARRYDMGERNDFVLVPMASMALEQILEWGVENIQAYTSQLTAMIAEHGAAQGWEVVPANLRVGHIIGLRKPGANLSEVAARLAQNKIYASVRGSVLRLSPNVYNSVEDVDKLFNALTY